jgi:hypothetical protein
MSAFELQITSSADDRGVEILRNDEIVAAFLITDEGRIDLRCLADLEAEVRMPLSVLMEAITVAIERSDVRYSKASIREDRRKDE